MSKQLSFIEKQLILNVQLLAEVDINILTRFNNDTIIKFPDDRLKELHNLLDFHYKNQWAKIRKQQIKVIQDGRN